METNRLQTLEKPRLRRTFLIYAALALVTSAAFEPVCKNDFIRLYDDGTYVADNQNVKGGINLKSVRWAFTTLYAANWHPLTWLSHTLDCQIFGLNSLWHHLINLLFHIANVLLLFYVFSKMTGAIWRSAFVAAIFAIHPLRVESVAWVAERKDVLSSFFWMLTLAIYIWYSAKPSLKRYLLVAISFCLGLMCKPMLVTLPLVLLLIDFWPLGRWQSIRRSIGKDLSALRTIADVLPARSMFALIIIEKIPLLVLSVISSVMTFIAQQKGGAMKHAATWPFETRLANALVSYLKYIGKMFYPSSLSVFYPQFVRKQGDLEPVVSFLVLASLSILVLWQIRRRPYLAVGWFWYLGTLVPVIGLVHFGGQAMADRYTYIPLIGISIMIAWAGGEFLKRWRQLRIWVAILVGLVFCALLIVTQMQVGYWRDDYTLFSHAVKVTQNNYLAHYNLAKSLERKGEYGQAIENYEKVVQIHPRDYEAYNNMGVMFLKQGQLDQAVLSYEQSLKIKPDYIAAIYNLGLAKLKQGRYEEAIAQFTRVLAVKPDLPEAHNELGDAYMQLCKYDLAIKSYEESLKFKPDYLTAMYNAGMAALRHGDYDKTVKYFHEALEQKPDWVIVLNSLAWILATAEDSRFQNPADAVKYAEKACKLINYKDAALLDTLAAAYASAGNFDEAIQTAEKAFKLAEDNKQEKLSREIQDHLKVYKTKQPWREHSPVSQEK
jgi:tetratricopeptide (TPR) repeat protein